MLNKEKENRYQVEFYCIDDLVPKNHLLRKIEEAVDFKKIYELTDELYCKGNGRPNVDSVVLFKMVMIQHLFSEHCSAAWVCSVPLKHCHFEVYAVYLRFDFALFSLADGVAFMTASPPLNFQPTNSVFLFASRLSIRFLIRRISALLFVM